MFSQSRSERTQNRLLEVKSPVGVTLALFLTPFGRLNIRCAHFCHNVIFVFYVHFKHPSRIYDASIKALDSMVPEKMTEQGHIEDKEVKSTSLEGLLIHKKFKSLIHILNIKFY